MVYRKEIDGLRAIAVLVVIFFHAGLSIFDGGYVGVDVFFVISGYLITSLIIEEIDNKLFSLTNFYERRLRRLLPSLFVVMSVSIPFAWYLMSPSQMKDFFQSLIAVSLFASNFLFWKEHNYFNPDAKEKPFLHTWSLGVEEQYYFLFPLFLLIIWRYGKNYTFWTIIFITFISFILSEWGSRSNAVGNFYLLPSRVWEILCGSIAALIIQKYGIKKNNYIASIGFCLIIFSVLFYNEDIPYPSSYTLLPVIGTLAIIIFADKQTYVATYLSFKPVVKIGLISYSAYLWHQPIFAFAKIYFQNNLNIIIVFFLISLTLILANITWYFVEKPFRKRDTFNKKKIILFSSIGIIFFITVGALGLKKEVYYLKFNDFQKNFLLDKQKNLTLLKTINGKNTCFIGYNQSANTLLKNNCVRSSNKQRVILFGDSKAAQYYDALKLYEKNLNVEIMQFTGVSCRPFKNRTTNRCKEFYDVFVDKVIPNLNSKDVIIISANWSRSVNTWPKNYDLTYEKSFVEIVSKLKPIVSKVILISNSPNFKKPYELLLMQNKKTNIYIKNIDNIALSEEILEKISIDNDISLIKPHKLFCKNKKCLYFDNNKYIFLDESHFSNYGAKIVIQKTLLNEINN